MCALAAVAGALRSPAPALSAVEGAALSAVVGRSDPAPKGAWKAIAVIAAGIVLDLLLVERAGFVLASTALFWLTARAFDQGHPLRDALFALGTSIGAYLLFARVLQLSLPAGVLGGWI
jgi:putative tricarboxylic transport membrane protein